MMKGQIIGIKKVDGVGKNGPYAFSIACITSPMSDFDIKKGAKGLNVHAVVVPDRLEHVLNVENIGKEILADYYFNYGKEYIAHAELVAPAPASK